MRIGDFGQPRVEALLDDMLGRGRAGGSLLFEGPPGVGKEALAVELGRLLNCENDPLCPAKPPFARAEAESPGAAPGGGARAGAKRPTGPARTGKGAAAAARTGRESIAGAGSSGRCGSCHKFDILQHPDLLLVFAVPKDVWDEPIPESRGEERKLHTIGRILQAKAANPYFRPQDFDRPSSIYAEILRERVLPMVHSRPVEGRVKTIVISEPELVQEAMTNILLKTLEEPPANCLVVLASAQPLQLLPTIRSRCQRFRFAPLAAEWMESRLEALFGAAPAQAKQAAAISQGSMLAGARFLEGGLKEGRDHAFGVFQAALAGETLDLLETAQQLDQEHMKRRHLVPVSLQMLAVVARDAVLVSQGVGAATGAGAGAEVGPRLVNADRRAEVEKIARAFSVESLRRIVRRAEALERPIAGGRLKVEHALAALFLDLAALASPEGKTR